MIIKMLKEEALKHNDKIEIVSIERLKDLKTEIEEFKSHNELNGFQNWIVNDLYDFDLPSLDFIAKSIIIVALHHPFYADVKLNYQNKVYNTKCLVRSDFHGSKRYIKDFVNLQGYNLKETKSIPLKRLAVQSGLAVYGKNNITYIDGMGSNLSYIAFYTDIPCFEDHWRPVCHFEFCDKCGNCVKHCPTGAIKKDSFLIDNEKCLSCINESAGDFPHWIPKNIHHTLYDCLRCQEHCPMNKSIINDKIGPITFTEEETSMLLDGKGPDDFPEEFLAKISNLGLFDWRDALPRNINAIIQANSN